jgi:hypothetical protein
MSRTRDMHYLDPSARPVRKDLHDPSDAGDVVCPVRVLRHMAANHKSGATAEDCVGADERDVRAESRRRTVRALGRTTIVP